MKISVLIPTFSRKDWLLKTLDCIALQTHRDFEVIIVDASAPELQVSDVQLRKFNFPINYVRYGVNGNISRQRNIALKLAVGEILLFLDDDVTFDENLFANYVGLFAQGKYQAVSGISETTKYRRGSPPIEYKRNRLFKIGSLNYMACDFEVETFVICTANFAMSRETYAVAGAFDEFMFGGFDDVHYGWKLQQLGIRVMHHPLVSVFHHQVRASGARSTELPGWWKYYNMFYFHLKNLQPSKAELFLSATWTEFRPSMRWIRITRLIRDYYNFVTAFQKAAANVNKIHHE